MGLSKTGECFRVAEGAHRRRKRGADDTVLRSRSQGSSTISPRSRPSGPLLRTKDLSEKNEHIERGRAYLPFSVWWRIALRSGRYSNLMHRSNIRTYRPLLTPPYNPSNTRSARR